MGRSPFDQENVMARHGEKAKEKVSAAMHEREAGALKGGKAPRARSHER
jgi:hypothetical protein